MWNETIPPRLDETDKIRLKFEDNVIDDVLFYGKINTNSGYVLSEWSLKDNLPKDMKVNDLIDAIKPLSPVLEN